MSLLREIQTDLAATGGDVASVLRKCKILAARLGSQEFARWIDWELNGYPESQATPPYRKLPCSCYANFINTAWRLNRQPVPLVLVPEEYREGLDSVQFREGIAKVMAFVPKGAQIDRPELIFLLQGKMYPSTNCVGAWMEIPGSEFEQLISAVKNRILDFVLEVEVQNPSAGEASPNSQPVPAEKLQPLVNYFFGSVGNVAQSSWDFTQTAKVPKQHQELAKLVTNIADHLDELNLGPSQRQKAEAQIATLKAQLSDDPDPVIVKQAGRTLRNITEGAIGSLIATAVQPGLWHGIQQTMGKLFS